MKNENEKVPSGCFRRWLPILYMGCNYVCIAEAQVG